MEEDRTIFVDQLRYYLTSSLLCSIIHRCREFLQLSARLVGLLFVPIKFIVQDESSAGGEEEEDGQDEVKSSGPAQCERCNGEGGGGGGGGALAYDEARAVVQRLGMAGWKSVDDDDGGEEGGCRGCRVMEGARELMEEKEASMEELEEAFYVFDRNEDGFICPAELWSVMRRLGLQEQIRLEDCERMIRVYDDDGDGKISFSEFRRLLECAI